jgi:hypothetical protein
LEPLVNTAITLAHLTEAPDAPAPLLVAAWKMANSHDREVWASEIAGHPNAPVEVLEEAARSALPRVRAAWLLRPERSPAELAEALGKERRADVLAAVAESPAVTDTQLVQLAGLNKRAVAWALLGRTLPTTAAEQILVTLDPAIRSATLHQRSRAVQFARSNPEALAAVGGQLTSAALLEVLAGSEQALSADVQMRCIESCLSQTTPNCLPRSVTPWEAARTAERVALSLLRRDDLDPDAARAIVAHFDNRRATARPVVEALEALRGGVEALAGGSTYSARVARAAVATDPDELQNAWAATPPGVWRTKVAEALWRNPATPGPLLVASAAAARVPHAVMAARIDALHHAGLLDDALLGALAGLGTWVVEHLMALVDPDRVRAVGIAALLSEHGPSDALRATRLADSGLLDTTTVVAVPAKYLDRLARDARSRSVLTDALCANLGSDPTAWELFAQVADTSPEVSLEALFATVAGALA